MSELNRLFDRIDSNTRAMVDLQKLLTAVPAIAPESGGDGEDQKALALTERLRKLGIKDIETLYAPDDRVSAGERPNIVATVPGACQTPCLWIMTHLDVVPPGDESLWDTPPFEAREADGKLFGRGCEDNGQAMVASVFAAASLLQEGLAPQRTIKLLFVADEEVGSQKGIHFLLNEHSIFNQDDMILVPDMGNPEGSVIEIAEKNLLWLKFETSGKQCHASTPDKGVNAFVAGSELVLGLNELNRIFDRRDDLFEPPVSAFSPTKKESNIPNVNTIPAEDVFYMDCRILPSLDTAEVKDRIRQIADLVSRKHGVTIESSVVMEQRSLPTPRDTPLVSSLGRAIRRVYGVEPGLVGIGGGTVAAPLRSKGYHTAVWSRIAATAHMPNEYCLIDNMVGDAKVMAHIMFAG